MINLKQHYLTLLVRERRYALLGTFLAIVTTFSGIALLAVSGWFISAAAAAGLSTITAHTFNFFTPGAMVRGLSISRTAGRYGERITSHEATFRIIAQLRADLFKFVAAQKWNEQQLNRHQVSSRLLQDIHNIESIYQFAVIPALTALAVSIGYLITLILVLPQLSLMVAPILFAVCILIPWLYSQRVLEPENTQQEQQSLMWMESSTLFNGIRTLTLFRQIEPRGATLQKQSEAMDRWEAKTLNRQQQVLLLSQISLAAMAIISFWQGFIAFNAGQLEGAYIFMLLLLTLGSAEVLAGTCPALASLVLGLRALSRLEAHSSSARQIEDQRLFQNPNKQEMAVHVKQLTYVYPQADKTVLRKLNFKQQGPEWIWLKGPSGCGKSTLLQLLNGDLNPTQGRIEFDGFQPHKVQFMPQRIDILRASLRDNLCLHHPHSDEQLWTALEQVELASWAKHLPHGLDTWLGENEWQPSGGESKRIGLARILLQDPNLILLDEPTAGLDTDLSVTLLQRLADQWKDKLVICSSHECFRKMNQNRSIQL
ncbi:amino acid ABC transporter ATP-binding/permease protein [Neptuniibacter caesariensis]|uniref:ABC transporter ATP-binding protein n=1 Tax=Neptuniibacter caesariensis TaxID=207954 RepID=A0A7U8C6D7_NEPCE|nr:ATP-binding cassette domain-containing protein [Neptuniibacter caesariensis]EAR62357.1 ABC transporter ATP-binding protein [Oceanospirillum sp. MED92] [Neptuniibacter caesariensis]